MKVWDGLYLAGMLMVLSVPASAHHSFAKYNEKAEVSVSGTVSDWQWTNPHIWLQLTTTTEGKQAQLGIEGSSPNNLVRDGIKKSMLKVGDKVTLIIHPANFGDSEGSLVRIVDINGTPLPKALDQ